MELVFFLLIITHTALIWRYIDKDSENRHKEIKRMISELKEKTDGA